MIECKKCLQFKHIENQFVDGMSWDNRYSPIDKERNNSYKTWSIDHIIPLSKIFESSDDEKTNILHYKNLRPVWHYLNLEKGCK